jgi:hypothetical protein
MVRIIFIILMPQQYTKLQRREHVTFYHNSPINLYILLLGWANIHSQRKIKNGDLLRNGK